MTNGGIIEGTQHRCGVSACAKVIDLSPVTYFGSGATRMQMRSQQWFGGIVVGRYPAPTTL